jgi:FkbM family methyltransferase
MWVRANPGDALRDKRIIICGSQCKGEIRFAAKHFDVLGIVDDYQSGKTDLILGLPVLTTDDWIASVKRDPSIVTMILVWSSAGYNHFKRCCAQHDIAHLNMLEFLRVSAAAGLPPAGGGGFMYGVPFFEHAADNAEELVRCAEWLEDDYSKFTFFSVLNYRLTGNPNILSLCAVGHNADRYSFNSYALNRSFFELNSKEIFVDGGAFDGNSVAQFLRAVDGQFGHIYSFEPFAESASKCRARVAGLAAIYGERIKDRISVIEKGLWDCVTTLEFNPDLFVGDDKALEGDHPNSGHVIGGGFMKHIYSEPEESAHGTRIQATTIDSACSDVVSLIKLEVEGSELRALMGARATINSNRPRLAISVYHKPEDLITLMQFIRDTGLHYRMSLRQHNPWVPDAMVCYCR